ncbi:MAG: cell wall hydrolase [Lachnospiraceae bacterium]|nr:cell wall hydrolase [Lachnospiraceae bacterium]
MKRNKKVFEGMTLAAFLVMLTCTAFAGSTEEGTKDVTQSVALNKNATAGIIVDLSNMEASAISESGIFTATIEKTQKDIVAKGSEALSDGLEALETNEAEIALRIVETETSEAESLAEVEVFVETDSLAETENPAETEIPVETESAVETESPVEAEASEENAQAVNAQEEQTAKEETEKKSKKKKKTNKKKKAKKAEQTAEEAEWANKVMANVEEDMNIRTAPDANSELAGKFYRGDVAEVVAVEGEWTQITSGNVTGYVKNEYLVYGTDACALANEVCSLYATVNTDGLRLREEPSEEAEIVTLAENGKRLKVEKEANTVDGWVAVQSSEGTAYVSAQYVNVALNLGTALNNEEVAEKEAKEAGRTKHAAVAASVDDVTLLGALIQCEAGNSSYEGMLAVGSVVMNRVRSGRYPGSISGVVYQSGQFPPALNGTVAAVISRGVKGSCLQAAQEAINGIDNTNGATSFRSARSGYAGTIIGGNVFF